MGNDQIMTTLTDERILELEAIAKRATPGPWIPEDRDWGINNGVIVEDISADGVCTEHNHGSRSWSRFVAVPAHDHACAIGSENHKNMQHIAAFSPAAALELIAELRRSRERCGRLEGVIEIMREPLEYYQDCEMEETGPAFDALAQVAKILGDK